MTDLFNPTSQTGQRVIRVFISSTFRDMHAERDHLVKVVFPALRERLETHRVHLIDIDLRWGVTREQAENGQALDVCLQQIDECRPFFVSLLGERYGWAPQGFSAETLKQYGWVQRFTGRSVTELEILYGALNNPGMHSRAFFYFRDPAALDHAPQDIKQAIYLESDPEQTRKLFDLKNRIRHSGYPVMDSYPARWDPQAYDRSSRSRGRLVGLEDFGERLRDQLWEAFKAELDFSDSPASATNIDPMAEELDFHKRFIESQLRVYVGREEIHQHLLESLNRNESKPVLVTGPSGSGKSATLARLCRACEGSYDVLVPHFVGASPASTSLHHTLRRLCLVLQEAFGFEGEVPQETNQLITTFHELLRRAPSDRSVLLVIDAIDQFEEANRGLELAWLPTALPPKLKLALSCTDESARDQTVLERARQLSLPELKMAPLTDDERLEIIRQIPSLSAKTLDQRQIDLLLANPATVNPLFLEVALEELRGFGSYEQLNTRIAAFPRGDDSVTAIFTQVIERLEEEFDSELAHHIFALLAVARRGLEERELQDLVRGLAAADNLFPVLRQLRPYLLDRAGLIGFFHHDLLRAVVGRYLNAPEKLRSGHARLADYFRSQAYWLESGDEHRAHARRASPASRLANERKVDELPWQYLLAGQSDELAALLFDPFFLEAKSEAGLVFDLASDLAEAVKLIPRDHHRERNLRLLEEAIRTEIHFLARHPETLFQSLWNRLWWYDCPEAINHYDPPEDGSPTEEPPWNRPVPKLYELLERWRRAKEKITPGFHWIRSLRPPPTQLGAASQAVFHLHQGMVSGIALSPDGRRAVSGATNGVLWIWDVATGAPICSLQRPDNVRCVAISPDGRHAASGSLERMIRVLDAINGQEVRCFRADWGAVFSLTFSADGQYLVAGCSDGTIEMWDVVTGERWGILALSAKDPVIAVAAESPNFGALLNQVEGVASVAVSPDGKWLASGSWDGTLRIWDLSAESLKHCLRGPKGMVTSLSFSPDGQRIASAGSVVRIWEVATGRKLISLRKDKGAESVAFSHSGRFLASGTYERTVHLWDTVNGSELARFLGHEDAVRSVAFSPDDQYIFSGSHDGTVRVWSAASDSRSARLRDSTIKPSKSAYYSLSGDEMSLAFSSDGSQLFSSAWDSTVRLWNVESGMQVACFYRPGVGNDFIFSPDRSRIASAGDGVIHLWDFASGELLASLQGHEDPIACLAFSPNGVCIASGSSFDRDPYDTTVRVWDTWSGAQLQCLKGHENGVRAVAFSSDGQLLASSSTDRTIRLWDPANGRELACFKSHKGSVSDLAFSPDNRRLICACSEAICVWEIASGACIVEIEGSGDLSSIAAGPTQFPYRALARGLETVVEDADTGAPVAYFPVRLHCIKTHPSGRTWAGVARNHLYLLRLEGI